MAVVVVACTTSSGSTIGGSSSNSSSAYPMYDTEASVSHRFSMYAQWKTSVLGFPHRFSMYAQCKTDQPKAFGDDMFGQCSNVKCTSDHNFKCTSDPNFKCTSDSSPLKAGAEVKDSIAQCAALGWTLAPLSVMRPSWTHSDPQFFFGGVRGSGPSLVKVRLRREVVAQLARNPGTCSSVLCPHGWWLNAAQFD